MKKLIIGLVAVVSLFLGTASVFAAPKNTTYLEWTWPKNVHKSGYFKASGSGIVQAWVYDHPVHGDARYMFKPLDKFSNSKEVSCKGKYLLENTNWQSQNLWQVMDDDNYKDAFDELFERPANYLLCIYHMNEVGK